MNYLNFDKMKGIRFPGYDELYIPMVQLYSWDKILRANGLFYKTKEYIEKWYLEKDGLEDVLNGIGTLWDTLKDTVAESNIQDFIKQGYLDFHKDMFKERYDRFSQPFQDGLQYITDFWFETTLNEAEKVAYRAARKENRPQTIGIGFGILGGLQALASSGLSNMATGAAHEIFNAFANGIGDIRKTNKLNEFYRKKSTLDSLIDGWKETFWLIYDDQIDIINSHLVEPETALLYKYKEYINLKESAKIKFENLQKAIGNVSDKDYLDANLQCIWAFPFEKEYWKYFYIIPFLSETTKSDMYDNIITFFKNIGEYSIDFYSDEFATELVLILMDLYIKNKEQNVKENIFTILKEKITDDDFEYLFDNAIEKLITNKNVSNGYIKQLLMLINRLDYDIDNFEHDEEFKKKYEDAIMLIALDYVKQNKSQIISELEKGQFDTILKDVTNDPTLDNDNLLTSVIYVIDEEIQNSKNISYASNLPENIEKLKTELKVDRDLNNLISFNKLKSQLTPIEDKIHLFNCFIQGIIDAHSNDILGDKSYWGKISSGKIKELKTNIGINDTEKILYAYDDSFLQSGKTGVVFTEAGIYGRTKDKSRFYLSWGDLANKHKISLYDSSFYIQNIGEERSFIEEIKFSGVVNISYHVLVNLIAGAGFIFNGKIVNIVNFKPVAGAEFDISKLEKKLSGIIKPDSNVLKNEEKTNSKETDDQESEPKQVVTSQKERENYYNFLKEEDRIFKAVKFKEKKGFFKRVLPSSWIVTILFYVFLSLIGMMFISFLAFEVINSEVMENIVFFAGIFALPISLLFFGIRKRVKYIKEKKWWKDCTNNGQKNIKDVFKEFQEMQDKYINNNGQL